MNTTKNSITIFDMQTEQSVELNRLSPGEIQVFERAGTELVYSGVTSPGRIVARLARKDGITHWIPMALDRPVSVDESKIREFLAAPIYYHLPGAPLGGNILVANVGGGFFQVTLFSCRAEERSEFLSRTEVLARLSRENGLWYFETEGGGRFAVNLEALNKYLNQ